MIIPYYPLTQWRSLWRFAIGCVREYEFAGTIPSKGALAVASNISLGPFCLARTMQNIEQKGGVHMDQHRRVLITQDSRKITPL